MYVVCVSSLELLEKRTGYFYICWFGSARPRGLCQRRPSQPRMHTVAYLDMLLHMFGVIILLQKNPLLLKPKTGMYYVSLLKIKLKHY